MITVMVQAFVVFPCGMIFCSAPRKNLTLSAVKEQAGVRSVRIYVGVRNANHSREESLCVSVLRKCFQPTVSFVLIISFRHGGDMIQTAVATLKQMN